jgi:hypothetical protein
MTIIRRIAALACFALAGPASAQESPLGWLQGQWCTEAVNGEQTCETWSAMENRVMRGSTEARHKGTNSIEQARITMEGAQFVFHAEPERQAPADFHSVDGQPPMSLRFENRGHDYPQVVRYWREGDVLMAEISLADGSKPNRWKYKRVK